MFCPKCGKDAGENKFCPECGTNLETGLPNEPVSEKKSLTKKKLAIIIGVIVILIILIIIPSISGKSKKSGENVNDSSVSSSAEGKTKATEVVTVSPKKQIEEAEALAAKGDYAGAAYALKSVTGNEEAALLLAEYREKALDNTLYQCYWKEDAMSDYHWAYANGVDNAVTNSNFLLYIHQEKANPQSYGFHLFSSFIGYVGSNEWIFPNTMRIKGDGEKYIDVAITDRKSDMDGRAMQEWFNFDISTEEFNSICELISTSQKVTIRFSGSSYYRDMELTEKQIEGVKTIYRYGLAFEKAY